jgi:hypothetical protein
MTPSAAPGPWTPLGTAWLGKWERSHVQFPDDLPLADQAAFATRIREHPQFCKPETGAR